MKVVSFKMFTSLVKGSEIVQIDNVAFELQYAFSQMWNQLNLTEPMHEEVLQPEMLFKHAVCSWG